MKRLRQLIDGMEQHGLLSISRLHCFAILRTLTMTPHTLNGKGRLSAVF